MQRRRCADAACKAVTTQHRLGWKLPSKLCAQLPAAYRPLVTAASQQLHFAQNHIPQRLVAWTEHQVVAYAVKAVFFWV